MDAVRKYPVMTKEGDSQFSEIYIPHLNKGRGAHLWFKASPLYDEAGNLTGAIESIRDINERKQTEETLRESEQQYRSILENANEGILIFDIDSGLFNHTNPSICRMLGYSKEEFQKWLLLLSIINSAISDVSTGRIMVHIKILPDIEVYADPIIRKVFTTLIENSIRHGGNLSSIRISTHKQKRALIVMYEDEGVGISEKEKDLIFKHGYGKHTGIGLFLAREILSITGLSIRETGVPGKGERFEIQVPIISDVSCLSVKIKEMMGRFHRYPLSS
ncbi:MAG: HAMP domain-containing sensor histidine kinase [Methanobacteriota archaeon]